MIVVTASTGHIGKSLTEILLSKNEKVRAVARDPKKLEELKKQGAETVTADVSDAAAMSKAFSGAKAVFTLIPPNYSAPDFRAYQNKVADALVSAIRQAGVKYVVNLSSIGGQLPKGNGPVAGLHEMEQKLNRLEGVNVLHLRPAFFMENVYFNVDLIKNSGINGTPLKADLAIPMIATQDIAARAAEALVGLKFAGKTIQELLGPRDISMKEVTALIGQAIGKNDLPYIQFPYADAQKAMTGAGISSDLARLFVEMYQGFNDDSIKPTEPRSAKSSTPTTFEDFVKGFAAAIKN